MAKGGRDDTSPSAQGTEYSFFMYDYLRPSWDDKKKSLTGPPASIHLKHAFKQTRRFIKEKWGTKKFKKKAGSDTERRWVVRNYLWLILYNAL